MSRRSFEPIAFIANPFVALADCLIVVMLILVLILVHTRLTSTEAIERVAIAQFQDQLLEELGAIPLRHNESPLTRPKVPTVLTKAFSRGWVRCCYQDGDLQRFWFNGQAFLPEGSVRMTSQGREVLAAFGQVLARHQGVRSTRGDESFKYLLVEGHSDTSEGDRFKVQGLARLRATEAERILRAGNQQVGLPEFLIRSYGRSDLDPVKSNFHPARLPDLLRGDEGKLHAYNKRIEIVVVFSGSQVLESLVE